MGLFSKRKYLRLSKGFYGRVNNCINLAIPKVEKSLQHAYRGRKLKQRTLREDWIRTINGGLFQHSLRYNQFAHFLAHSNIQLDRKILADLAINEPFSFKAVIDELRVQGKAAPTQDEFNLLDGYTQGWIIDTKDIRPEDFEAGERPINLRVSDPRVAESREYYRKANQMWKAGKAMGKSTQDVKGWVNENPVPEGKKQPAK